MNYQVIKLSNGEDIVCKVHENSSSRENSKLKISSPLKMETYSRATSKGLVESLGLSRWVQPYSDEKKFTIYRLFNLGFRLIFYAQFEYSFYIFL